MEKCHCSGIRFEKVLEKAQIEEKDYREAAKELDVCETCRACKEDLIQFCESHMNLCSA